MTAVEAAATALPRAVADRGRLLAPRTLVGRQPIVTSGGGVHAYELLYRSPDGTPVRVDTWGADAQDHATGVVLDAMTQSDVPVVVGTADVFVNVTRSFLVGELPLPRYDRRLVLEVVESVVVDAEVLDGVARLRAAGYRIAIDDFVGLRRQHAVLPLADYVKVDVRDLARLGPRLLDSARSHGATLVAERVEDAATLMQLQEAGFALFQGDALGATAVLDLGPTIPAPRSA